RAEGEDDQIGIDLLEELGDAVRGRELEDTSALPDVAVELAALGLEARLEGLAQASSDHRVAGVQHARVLLRGRRGHVGLGVRRALELWLARGDGGRRGVAIALVCPTPARGDEDDDEGCAAHRGGSLAQTRACKEGFAFGRMCVSVRAMVRRTLIF